MHLDTILDKLHFAYRQKIALLEARRLLGEFPWKRMLSTFVLVCELLSCAVFDTPYSPHGDALSLSDYALVLCDEFDGDALDTDVWSYRASGSRRGGFNAESQVRVQDGNMILTGEYRTDGMYGEGWYTGMVSLRERYTNGYFEIRCKCNKGTGFWSAFWLQSPNAYSHTGSNGGLNGAEIDIFESSCTPRLAGADRGSVATTIHCNGWDADEEHIDSRILGEFKVDDMFDSFNTYGLEWTEDEYIFYINGVESCRSSFGKGVSVTPEEVIVSLEIPEISKLKFDHDYSTQMIVDYVKIYQKISLAGE